MRFTSTWYSGLEDVTKSLSQTLGDQLQKAREDWGATYKMYSASLGEHVKRLESKKSRAQEDIDALKEKKRQADDDDDADAWQEADEMIQKCQDRLTSIQKEIR